jgi:hypothetical protein
MPTRMYGGVAGEAGDPSPYADFANLFLPGFHRIPND